MGFNSSLEPSPNAWNGGSELGNWLPLTGLGNLPVPLWLEEVELSFLVAFLAGEEWALGVPTLAGYSGTV